MIDALQMMHLIKSSLEKLGLKYASHDAMMLVYRTGLVESKYKYLSQKGSDIARGFWQCEPWVAVSLCKDYLQYRDSLMKKVADVCYLDWKYFTDPTEEDWKQRIKNEIIEDRREFNLKLEEEKQRQIDKQAAIEVEKRMEEEMKRREVQTDP